MQDKQYYQIVWQLMKFSLVGVSNAIVLLLTYNLALLFVRHYQIAYVIGFIISVMNAFFWNNKYVFKSGKKKIIGKIVKVYASYIITYIISALLLFVWIDLIQVNEKIAPIINIVITTPINFLLNKLWAFKKQD